jgi:hypothetical protein
VVAIAAAAVLVVAVTQLVESSDEVRTTTAGPDDVGLPGRPNAEVSRLLVEGAPLVDSTGGPGSQTAPAKLFQAFRRPGRLDGPMVFLNTLRPYIPSDVSDEPCGDPIVVRGHDGFISHPNGDAGATTLLVDLGDGTAIDVSAIGLDDAELGAFVDGLDRAGPDQPWTIPTSPHGMGEVPVATPSYGPSYGAVFALPDAATGPDFVPGREYGEPATMVPRQPGPCDSAYLRLHEFVVAGPEEYFGVTQPPDGFERLLANRVLSTTGPVEMVDVNGVPAAVGAYSDLDWWVMMEPEPGRALELRIGNNRATVDWIIAHARFVDEAAWDAAGGGR